jgi:hypothetical protein
MSTDSVRDDQPPDLATIMADDELLDALGRGDPVPTDESVVTLLAAWRADLTAAGPATGEGGHADPAYPGSVLTAHGADPGAVDRGRLRSGGPADAADLGFDDDRAAPGDRSGRPVRRRRYRRWAMGAAAAAVGVALIGAGAQHAGPGSPLWPVTQAVFPERADVRAAEEAIDLARTALRAGRYDDARARLDDATGHLARVRDTESVARLRQDIDDVRRTLADAVPSVHRPPASAPSAAGPTPGVSRPPAGKPPAPGASGSQPSASGPPPLLPSLLPLPLPSLPPLLPSPTAAPAGHDCPLLCLFGQIR